MTSWVKVSSHQYIFVVHWGSEDPTPENRIHLKHKLVVVWSSVVTFWGVSSFFCYNCCELTLTHDMTHKKNTHLAGKLLPSCSLCKYQTIQIPNMFSIKIISSITIWILGLPRMGCALNDWFHWAKSSDTPIMVYAKFNYRSALLPVN